MPSITRQATQPSSGLAPIAEPRTDRPPRSRSSSSRPRDDHLNYATVPPVTKKSRISDSDSGILVGDILRKSLQERMKQDGNRAKGAGEIEDGGADKGGGPGGGRKIVGDIWASLGRGGGK